MLKRYTDELEKRGVNNIDIILEDGRFYSKLKQSGENSVLVGFNGAIDLEDNSLIYTKRTCKNNENALIVYSNVLVLDNFKGENKVINLSQVEERDCIELYEEYILNPELFEEKQHILEKNIILI